MEPTDHDADHLPVITAANVLAWRSGPGTGRPANIPNRVLVALDRSIVDGIRRRHTVRDAPGPAGRFAIIRPRTGPPLGVLVPPGLGGPAMAVAVEEACALGAGELVLIGMAGGITPTARPGTILLLDAALPRDGTSLAYGAGPGPVPADVPLTGEIAGRLERAGVAFERATSWTTDTVYRETPEAIRSAVAGGAHVVEMEAAGLFAVTRALGIRAAAVVVVADSVSDLIWQPPPDLSGCRRSLGAVAHALLAS